MKTLVLSNYPLSRPYKSRLEAAVDTTPEYLVVSELRQQSLGTLLGRLAGAQADTLYVPVEDESSRALLPVLEMLAAITRAHRIVAVDEQLAFRPLGRLSAVGSGFRLVGTSVLARLALARMHRAARTLLAAERIQVRSPASTRVAYLNCNLWFGVKAGGSVGHISGVANALSDLGHEVEFYSVGGRLLVDDRAEHVALAPPAMLAMPFETTYYRFDESCEAQIRARFAVRNPGFIYQRMSIGNFTGVRLSREFGIPLVLEYNGSEAWIAKNWGRSLRYHQAAVDAEDACLRHAHLVVTVSDVLGDELANRGVARERIVVYPNCIDPLVFDPRRFSLAESNQLREQLGFGPADVIATFVGTFGQWHGVDVLALAIRKLLLDSRPEVEGLRLRFLLIGDGVNMPKVRAALDGLDTEGVVQLTGLIPQKETPAYLAASDILLSPHVANSDGSPFFGSPTKLFEYMAMGKAIVASDLDQIGQVLRPAIRAADGVDDHAGLVLPEACAVLVAPGDVTALATAVLDLSGSPQLRSLLGRNCRDKALREYTWQKHVSAFLRPLTATR